MCFEKAPWQAEWEDQFRIAWTGELCNFYSKYLIRMVWNFVVFFYDALSAFYFIDTLGKG